MGPPPTTSSRMSEDEEIELIDTPSTQGPRRPRAARSRSRYDSEPDEDERYGSESYDPLSVSLGSFVIWWGSLGHSVAHALFL